MNFYCPECGSPLDQRIKNPHNEKEEFCSEECARYNRIDFCQETPKVYILFGGKDRSTSRGVYSKDNLHLGVRYWMGIYPEETLAYEEWAVGYPQEPLGWEWCYISPNSNRDNLAAGGGLVPKKEYWGKNLVGVTWEADEE